MGMVEIDHGNEGNWRSGLEVRPVRGYSNETRKVEDWRHNEAHNFNRVLEHR